MNKKNVYLLARNRSVYLEQLLMNRIRLLMMLLMSMAGALAMYGQTVRSGQTACGTLVFDSLRIDMGRVEKDSAAVAVFHFRVDGDAPVCIQRAAAACNCTVATFPKAPLRPGEKGQIVVRYNSKGMPPGYFRKVVVVRSNASEPLMKLSVSGMVKREKKIKDI